MNKVHGAIVLCMAFQKNPRKPNAGLLMNEN
jgi:hypothetical protein